MFSSHFIKDVGWWPFVRRLAWRQFNKRVLGRGVRIRLPTGLTMEAPVWSQSASEVIYTGANVDWGSESVLVEALDRQGTFLDIGVHVGNYSLYADPRVAKTYAFEPDEQSFAAPVSNLGCCDHAEAINKAVYSSSGGITVSKRRGTMDFSHLDTTTNPNEVGAREIEVVTVDDWMRDRPDQRVTGIKIDIDGLDLDVLKGATATLSRDQPLVLTEFLPSETNNVDDLHRFAHNADYDIFAFQRSSNGRIAFGRVGRDSMAGMDIKMIFLVPPRLKENFARRCG